MIRPTFRTVAPIALAALVLPSWQDSASPLDAAVAMDGAVFLLESAGKRSLAVKVRRGREESVTSLDLAVLPEGTRVVEARVVPWEVAGGSDSVAIAMVLEHEGGHAYRFLVNPFTTPSEPFMLSEPIFESHGEPFRIIGVQAMGSTADELEITFRRGKHSARRKGGEIEERVYVDTCTPMGLAGSKLYDVLTGRQIE